MKATLRERQAGPGKVSLYLDIYPPAPHPISGKMTRKYALGITVLTAPRTREERDAVKAARTLARAMQAKIELRLQAQDFGFLIRDQKAPLGDQMRRAAAEARTNGKQYLRCLQLIEARYGEGLSLQYLTPAVLADFRAYLLDNFSQNTASAYLTRLLRVLKSTWSQGMLKENPGASIKAIATERGEVVYLERHEIEALMKTECESQTLKRAFLLACETGLRISDIEALRREHFHATDSGPEIRIAQKKTGKTLTIPITAELLDYLELPESGPLFRGLKYRAYHGTLARWIADAGIHKKITFHKARHTCATQLIAADVGLATTQALLGHKSIASTLIYTHVFDAKKREAIEKKKIVK